MLVAQLIYPDYCHEEAAKKFVSDICQYDQTDLVNGSGLYMDYQNDYKGWIRKEKKMHLGIDLDDGYVPGTTYLYMIHHEVIGMMNIRHCLNEYLLKKGGHIGYSIHPHYRRQGYATQMLKDALDLCQQWEIVPTLVTCNKHNIASRKTIEKCGGVFENECKDGEETILRFWIGEKQ